MRPTRPTPPGSVATAPPPASTTKSDACRDRRRPHAGPFHDRHQTLAAADQPAPIGPRREWHQRQSIDYLLSSIAPSRYRVEVSRGFSSASTAPARIPSSAAAAIPDPHAQTHRRRRAAYAKEQSAGRSRGEVARATADWKAASDGTNLPLKYWEQAPGRPRPRGCIVLRTSRISHRHSLRSGAAEGRNRGARAPPRRYRCRQNVSGRVVRSASGAGLPSPPARHVRAAWDHPNIRIPRRPAQRPYDITVHSAFKWASGSTDRTA